MSRRLDRSRPLWELTVDRGPRADGARRAAGEDAPRARRRRRGGRHRHGPARPDARAARHPAARRAVGAARPTTAAPPRAARARRRSCARQKLLLDSAQRALAPDPRRAAGDLRSATELLVASSRATRPSAPMTPLNAGHRAQPPLRLRARAAGRPQGARARRRARRSTTRCWPPSPACCAATCEAAGEPIGQPLVALVPVQRAPARRGGRQPHLDGARRPARRRARPRRADRRDPRGDDRDQGLRRRARRRAARRRDAAGRRRSSPPTLARAMGGVRAFNLVVSNVPGPQQPFWLNGCRLLAVHPAVPLNPADAGPDRRGPQLRRQRLLRPAGRPRPRAAAGRDARGARRGHRRPPGQVCAARPRVTVSSARPVRPAGHQEEGSHGTSGT